MSWTFDKSAAYTPNSFRVSAVSPNLIEHDTQSRIQYEILHTSFKGRVWNSVSVYFLRFFSHENTNKLMFLKLPRHVA